MPTAETTLIPASGNQRAAKRSLTSDARSCVGHREVSGEALAGGEHKPAIEPRKSFSNRDADAVLGAEGNMGGRDIARSDPIPRGQRPWHVQTLLLREPGGLTRDRLCQHIGPHREGEEL
jgi:hypothetical protein